MAALSIKDKVSHVLQESKVVLPGTQALLGFQFVAVFNDGFTKLPAYLQAVHLLSLLAVTISTVLLMASVAFHRIVEGGEDTQRFYTFTSNVLLAGMIFLTFGLAGDLFVVIVKVTNGFTLALIAALAILIATFLLWFGFPYYERKHS